MMRGQKDIKLIEWVFVQQEFKGKFFALQSDSL